MLSLKFRRQDLDRLRDKLTRQFPAAVLEALREANEKSAIDLADLIHGVIPKDPKPEGELADTIVVKPADHSATGYQVSIGDDAHPYPAHLEFGHRSPGGSHVPAEPFFFPSLRIEKTRMRARSIRAMNAAIKKIAIHD